MDAESTQTALNQTEESPTTVQPATANAEVVTEESTTSNPSLQETLAGIRAKSAGEETSASENSEVPKENPTEEKGEETVAPKEEPATETTPTEPEPGKAVPYDRFKQVNEEKKQYEEQLAQAQPYVERAQNLDRFISENNISTEDLTNSLEIAALINSGNDATALEKLTPIYNALLERSGQRLPDDLKKQVEEGLLTNDAAKQMATLRREKQTLESQHKRNGEQQRQQQQQELNTSLDAFTKNRMKLDPDFKPKQDAKQPDGKFELVRDRFQFLWRTVPVNTVAEAVALADRAYSEIQQTFKRFSTQPQARHVKVTSNGSSTTKAKEVIDTTKPGWHKKVASQVRARHGL